MFRSSSFTNPLSKCLQVIGLAKAVYLPVYLQLNNNDNVTSSVLIVNYSDHSGELNSQPIPKPLGYPAFSSDLDTN